MKKIFALLAGINDYPQPISGLQGCLKDVEQIEQYLLKNFGAGAPAETEIDRLPLITDGQLQLCRLTDEKATYRNLTFAFRNFLAQAGPEDVAWFHFSGHGSEAFTAQEFLDLEPNGKDQTLVCYRESDTEELHLADKELAVLLHQLANQYPDGSPKQSPHIVVSLDCCHSGSGTRDLDESSGLRIRGIKLAGPAQQILARGANLDGRELSSYAGGYYTRQWQEKQSLSMPDSKHILLSACESIQKAGDLPGGGIFTSSLIDTLEKTKGEINYADLFVRTRAKARSLRREQLPQFEALGNFDPYTRFLEGSTLGTPERYEVFHENDRWWVKCGAIHGLPVSSSEPIELEIRTAAPENQLVAQANIKGVGTQKSRFELIGDVDLDRNNDYQAVIRFLPLPPVFVWLKGDTEGIQWLKDRWDPSKNIRCLEAGEELDLASIQVTADQDHYVITDLLQEREVLQRPMDADNARLIVDSLGKMVRWERTITLDNPHSGLLKFADLELGVANKRGEKTKYQTTEVVIELSKSDHFFDPNSGAIGIPFFPSLLLKRTTQPVYAYLFHLRSNYSIESYEGEVVFRPAEHPNSDALEIPLWKKAKGWGLSPDEATATSYFKLLVTTESLDYQQFLQSGLGGDRHTAPDWNPIAVDDAWASITYKVRLQRKQ